MNHLKNLEYLYSLIRLGIKTDLRNITALCERFGHPQNSYPIIHIAGTNGKGSTAAMISSVLTASGLKCGLYTSPHLINFGERIRIDGKIISDEEASEMIEELRPVFDELQSTFFESTTLMAFLRFARENIDVAVVETGLGGTLDATNIVNSSVSVFTPISYDHTDRLGTELHLIAADKAGIIKPNTITVSSQQEPEALNELTKRAVQQNSDFIYAPDFASISDGEESDSGSFVNIECPTDEDLSGQYSISAPGKHQWMNLQTTLTALYAIKKCGIGNIASSSVKEGIEKFRWKGRLEILRDNPRVYYDVAHNPAAAKVVAEFFQRQFPDKKVHIVLGIAIDKDAEKTLATLAPIAADFTFVKIDNPRAADPERLASIAKIFDIPIQTLIDPSIALEQVIKEAKKDDLVLLTGSHYLAGTAHKNLTK